MSVRPAFVLMAEVIGEEEPAGYALVATNADAIRLYERRDFVPCLVSYHGRPVLRGPADEGDPP
jgi:hypothetical protein